MLIELPDSLKNTHSLIELPVDMGFNTRGNGPTISFAVPRGHTLPYTTVEMVNYEHLFVLKAGVHKVQPLWANTTDVWIVNPDTKKWEQLKDNLTSL